MKDQQNFNIPEPCPEDWQGMKQEEKGNFCNKCQKVVRDMRESTTEEIAKFFVQGKGKACGLFYEHQLIVQPKPKITFLRRFCFALLVVFGGTLFQMNSALAQQVDTLREGTSIVVNGKEIKKDFSLKGIAIDSYDEEPVPFATITLYDNNGKSIKTSTNEKGEFNLLFNKEDFETVEKLNVSARTNHRYSGYSTITVNANEKMEGIVVKMHHRKLMGVVARPIITHKHPVREESK